MKKQVKKYKKIIIGLFAVVFLASAFFIFFQKTQDAEASWWNDDWLYRKELTINSSLVSADLTDFPVLLKMSDADLSAKAREDGGDIIFVNHQGQKFSHEIESYASTTGALVAWVKIPELSGSHDQTIYMYYGNATAPNQQDVANVWDENYVGVWHKEDETASSIVDSTRNQNTGVKVGDNEPNEVDGKVGNAQDYDGSNDSIDIPASDFDDIETMTASVWVYPRSIDTSWSRIIHKGDSSGNTRGFILAQHSGNRFAGIYQPSYTSNQIIQRTSPQQNNQWYYLVMVHDNETGVVDMYINGQLDNLDSVSSSWFATGNNFSIGKRAGEETVHFNGLIDEIRISNIVRSPDWIQTEYNNQNDPSAFFGASSEEIGPGPFFHLTFDQGFGDVAFDESSSGKNADIVGASWRQESDCRIGKCLFFDGVDDVATVAGFKLPTEDKFSISKWINFKNLTAGKPIIGQWGGSQNNFLVKLDDIDSSKLKICLASGLTDDCSIYASSAGSEISADKWLNLQIIYNGSALTNAGRLNIYIDGSQKDLVFSGSIPSSIQNDSLTPLTIGTNSENFTNLFFDETKFYAYARTADQIKQDYNAGLAGVSTPKGTSVSFGSASESSLTDGLVGYWKFDETATTSGAIDSSGNGNTGTYYGNASTTSGKFGSGGVFDGSGDFINVGTYGAVTDFSKSFSISAWVRPTTVSGNHQIYSASSNVQFFQSGANLRYFTNAKNIQADNVFVSGEWKFVTVTYNQEEISLFVDGELKLSEVHSAIYSGVSDNFIGVYAHTGNTEYFQGNIDEVRIYNRALSPDEVQKLYEWAPGPIVHLKMDELSGTTAYDVSGNENNGAITGALWDRGKYGGALSFDGVNDYVALNNLSLNNTNAVTVSFWFKSDYLTSDNKMLFEYSNNGYVNNAFYINMNELGEPGSFSLLDGNNTSLFNSVYTANSYVDGNWHHFVGVIDRSLEAAEKTKIFVNGVNDSVKRHNLDTTGNLGGPFNAYIFSRAGNVEFVDGLIDDFKIYNYARTQKQILEDMGGGRPAVNSPVLHLSFDEGFGGTAYDSSGYGNHGTLSAGGSGGNTTVSSMWTKNGKVGGAMEFDGNNDYVEVSNNPSLASDNFSISTRIYFYNTPSSGRNYILERGNGSESNYYLWYDGSNSRYVFGYRNASDNAWIDYYYNTYPTPNTWYHLVFTRKDTTLFLYIDGVEVISETDSEEPYSNGNQPLYIGIDPNQTSTWSHDGLIDEVKIYPYALSESKIKTLYNNSSSIVMGGGGASADNNGTTVTGDNAKYCIPGDTAKCDKPVLELKFDEKQGATAFDTSGYGNDGTINGATWGRGKYGSALSFDGINDYLRINDLALNNTNAVTISFWFNTDYLTSDNKMLFEPYGSNTFYINMNEWGVDGCLSMQDNGSGFNTVYTSKSYADGKWHHFTGVIDRNQGVDQNMIFVNGVRDFIQYSSRYNDINGNFGGPYNTYIFSRAGNVEFVDGLIDQVLVYDYARTPAQIAWDYNRGKPIAHWRFDEHEGTTVYDESGNGNHGTMHNMDPVDSRVAGKINKALEFDGVNDYVVTPSIDLSGTNVVTLSFWFNHEYENRDSTAFEFSNNFNNFYDGFAFFPDSTYCYGEISVALRGNLSYSAGCYQRPSSGVWHHFVAIYDKSKNGDEIDLYIDGIEQTPTNRPFNSNNSNNFGDHPLFMMSRGGVNEFEDGQIDEVKIYNYRLTPEQVKLDYNNGAIRFGE
jgi:hypothetical protein